MADASQEKLRKMLEMLVTLANSTYGRDKKQLAEHFGIDTKTVGRYMATFEEVGFVFDQPRKGFYKIDKLHSEYKDLSQLLYFSEEESTILNRAISEIEAPDQLKDQLVKKLYSIYNFDRVATPLVMKQEQEKVEAVSKAIRTGKQVMLYNYKSNHTGTISDRLLEPFQFVQSFTSFWAYEPESGKNKTFKIARFGKIEVLDSEQLFTDQHIKMNLDVFRMSLDDASMPQTVVLQLSLKAKNLLVEEFPLSEKSITKLDENTYALEIEVNSFKGIGRFILGLTNDIEVIHPKELKLYLQGLMENFLLKLK